MQKIAVVLFCLLVLPVAAQTKTPQIIKRVAILNYVGQGAELAWNPLMIAPKTGFYRISIYSEPVSSGPIGGSEAIQFSNALGTFSTIGTGWDMNLQQGMYGSTTALVSAPQGSTIFYQHCFYNTGAIVNVHYIVEWLGNDMTAP